MVHLPVTLLTFTGDKAAAEDSLRQMSHLIKSTAGMAPMAANQVALAAHKEVEVSLSMPAKAHSPQHQRMMMKHKAGQVLSKPLFLSLHVDTHPFQIL